MINNRMRIRVYFNHWIYKLPKMMEGIVLYPFVLFRNGPSESRYLFRHELEHVYQVRRDGFFKFYIKYIWYNFKVGYWNNPYEAEARAVQNHPLTEQEQAMWDKAVAEHEQRN